MCHRLVLFSKNCDNFVAAFVPKYLEFMAEAVVCCKRTSFYACERTGRLHVIQGVQASDNVALLETHDLPFFFCFMYHKNETKSWLIFQVSSQRIVFALGLPILPIYKAAFNAHPCSTNSLDHVHIPLYDSFTGSR